MGSQITGWWGSVDWAWACEAKGLWFDSLRIRAWEAGQLPSRGRVRDNHTLMFLSVSFSLSSPLSKNK